MTPNWTVAELHDFTQLLTMKRQGMPVYTYLYALLDQGLKHFANGRITEGTLLRIHRWASALKKIAEEMTDQQIVELINGRLPEGPEFSSLRETLARAEDRDWSVGSA